MPPSDSGTDRLGISVAGRLRRNRKITSTTSATASSNSNSTSATEARIVSVRSLKMLISSAGGISATTLGSSFLTASATWITLAPGWRWMFRISDGVLFAQAARFLFSGAMITVATSAKCTGAAFR